MSNPYSLVKEFHSTFNIPKADINNKEALLFRLRLIAEEFEEVMDAANCQFSRSMYGPVEVYEHRDGSLNRASLLKELADLLYVIYGTAETFGWDIDEAFKRVHQSNMSKLDEAGRPIYREDGKVIKGKFYKEPDLKDLV